MERLTDRADDGDRLARDHDGRASLIGVGLLGHDGAQLAAFVRGRTHERDLRIMDVEITSGELGRHRGLLAKIYHVEAAWGDDHGDVRLGGGVHTLGAGVKIAADEFVGPFGRGDIKDAGDDAALDDRFHDASTRAGGGEDQDFVTSGFEDLLGFGDTGGRVAELAGDDEGLRGADFGDGADHAADRAGGAGEDDAREAVQARHVGDARHHRDVLRAEVRGDIACGQGRDHQLREAEGQGAHRGGTDGRTAAAAERDDAVDLTFAGEFGHAGRGGLGHGHDAFAAILLCHQAGQVDARRSGDLLTGDIGLHRGGAAGADVDQQRLVAVLDDERGHEGMFFALGIKRTENCDRGHGLRRTYASPGSA